MFEVEEGPSSNISNGCKLLWETDGHKSMNSILYATKMSTVYVRSLFSHSRCYNFGPKKGYTSFYNTILKTLFSKNCTIFVTYTRWSGSLRLLLVAAAIGPGKNKLAENSEAL